MSVNPKLHYPISMLMQQMERVHNEGTRYVGYKPTEIAWLVDNAVKFKLGDFDDIPDNVEGLESEVLRLPFPLVLFEFAESKGEMTPIFIARQEPEEEGIQIWLTDMSVRDSDQHRIANYPLGAYLERGEHEYIMYGDELCEKDMSEEDSERYLEWLRTKAFWALTIIRYINQSNITYIDNPVSEKLNKKRKKRGKPPLYSYKTLKISLDKIVNVSKNENPQERAPYRAHERRGNWHTSKKTGKRWWVRSCKVGDKSVGSIKKDYEVKV